MVYHMVTRGRYQHIMKDEMLNFAACIDGISTEQAIDAEKMEVQREGRASDSGRASRGDVDNV